MNILNALVNAVSDAITRQPDNVAVLTNGEEEITITFDSPEAKESWIDHLDAVTPSEVSYYDALMEAIDSYGHEED